MGDSRPDTDPDWTLLTAHPALEDIIGRFADEGVPLHVVGGPVRDMFDLGTPGDDLDLCSPADVPTMRGLVEDLGTVEDSGEQYGTVKVHRPMDDGTYIKAEVTQWRAEAYHSDSRKPDTVATSSLHDDLARRDFTVNAIALDTATSEIVDPFGGRDDLARGLLRSVGDADERFSEDPLRIVRLARFHAVRGWDIDPATRAAAIRQRERLDIVADERIRAETTKMLDAGPDAFVRGLKVLDDLGITGRVTGLHLASGAIRRPTVLASRTERIAAMLWADRSDSHDPMVRLESAAQRMRDAKWSHTDVNDAVTLAKLSDAIPDVDYVGARRLVRNHSDSQLDGATRVLAATTSRPGPDAIASADYYASPALGPARDEAARWRAPLPVNGHDGIAAGLKGPQVGAWLAAVETQLLTHGTISRDDAIALAASA